MRPGDRLGGSFPASAALGGNFSRTHLCFPVEIGKGSVGRYGESSNFCFDEMKRKRGLLIWFYNEEGSAVIGGTRFHADRQRGSKRIFIV